MSRLVVQLDRAAELLRGGVRVALGERDLAERVGERGERVGVAASAAIADSASAHARASPSAPLRAKCTAAQRRPQTA